MTRLLMSMVAVACAAGEARAQAVPRDSVVYAFAPASRLEVKTGKAGLLGFAGHEHVIRARTFTGRIVSFPDSLAASRVDVTVAADGLEVLTPPDTAEIRQVTAAMRTEVLDVAHYPRITLVTRSVRRTPDGIRLVGALTLKDHTREIPVDVAMSMGADTLRARATFGVNQSDFGIRPYRGGPGGAVRVADRISFTIDIVAVREAGERH
jgi:polyisoprenoid-binding protein YceI